MDQQESSHVLLNPPPPEFQAVQAVDPSSRSRNAVLALQSRVDPVRVRFGVLSAGRRLTRMQFLVTAQATEED